MLKSPIDASSGASPAVAGVDTSKLAVNYSLSGLSNANLSVNIATHQNWLGLTLTVVTSANDLTGSTFNGVIDDNHVGAANGGGGLLELAKQGTGVIVLAGAARLGLPLPDFSPIFGLLCALLTMEIVWLGFRNGSQASALRYPGLWALALSGANRTKGTNAGRMGVSRVGVGQDL